MCWQLSLHCECVATFIIFNVQNSLADTVHEFTAHVEVCKLLPYQHTEQEQSEVLFYWTELIQVAKELVDGGEEVGYKKIFNTPENRPCLLGN